MSDLIGNLLHFEAKKGEPEHFRGSVDLIGVPAGTLFVVPNERKDKQRGDPPDFKIRVRLANSGQVVNVGSAWRKQFKAPREGWFLSLTFDHPGMREPIYAAAFPLDPDEQPDPEKRDHFNIVWKRPARHGVRSQPAEPFNDAVPY